MELHNSAETSTRQQQFKAWWESLWSYIIVLKHPPGNNSRHGGKSLWSYIIVLKHPPGNNNSRHGGSLFGAT